MKLLGSDLGCVLFLQHVYVNELEVPHFVVQLACPDALWRLHDDADNVTNLDAKEHNLSLRQV